MAKYYRFMNFSEFITLSISEITVLYTVLIIFAVAFVNGWTDAPNAIATVVSTGSMRPKTAILMAAVMNFAGVLVMSLVSSKVADTIYKMVDFKGDAHNVLVALCASLFAIVLWAVAAWWFGIPTSESHALIAGISGAAIFLQKGISGINGGEWAKVLYGLVLSSVLGFGLGFIIAKLIKTICKNILTMFCY